MIPRRIQLRRTKGWRMPPNTVKVDRSTKWGNPYRAGIHSDHQHAVDLHRMALLTGKCRSAGGGGYSVSAEDVMLYCIGVHSEINELRGKNLACWCSLDQPCHADVLLEIATSDSRLKPLVETAQQARCEATKAAVPQAIAPKG